MRALTQIEPELPDCLSEGPFPLPDYLIIGAQKCGTHSLYQYLRTHPNVARARKKELHFFDHRFHEGVDWYRSRFCFTTEDRYVTGEASPMYLFHPRVPGRVRDVLPDVKLIVLLRNPVDRAYSHYQSQVRKEYERLSFAEAIRHEPKVLRGEVGRVAVKERYRSSLFERKSYVMRGIYVDQLLRWRQFFPAEQMLILHSADLHWDPSATCGRVFRFLGLPPHELGDVTYYSTGTYEPMEPKMRQKLAELFRPHNERLYRELGIDFGWDD